MRGLPVLGVLALLSVAGCTITAVSAEDDSRTNNQCASTSDCPTGNCSGGICQELNGELEALLFEITPPSDSEQAHIPFLAHVEDVPTSGGTKIIPLTRPAHVIGSLKLAKGSECRPTFYDDFGLARPQPSDGISLPVTVTFSPRERLLGLSSQVYSTTTSELDANNNYTFEAQVPVGEYDVYVAPPRNQSGCQVAPHLFRREAIVGGEFDLQYPVTPASNLTLDIHWPSSSGRLDGWVADIIEPLTGNSISTQFVLQNPVGSSTLQYDVPLTYSAVFDRPSTDSAVTERGKTQEEKRTLVSANDDLVRLTPPPTTVAPTLYIDRSGLGLFCDAPPKPCTAIVDGFSKLPTPVTVEGQVARVDTGKPTQGQVTLVSSEISGLDPGVFAAFQRTVPVGADGRFALLLPPGKYRVYAVPPMADGLAAFETTWDIPPDVAYQAGKLLELPPTTQVTGRTILQGAQVQALASPQQVLPFERAFGGAIFVPRANPGLVAADGTFVVQADPGTFDISVRPPESLGFAWFVRPSVMIGTGSQDLGKLALPRPSVVTGLAEVAAADSNSQPVSVNSAFIRAYAYLDENLAYTRDVTRATSVVQVAETRADESGAFKLLIPPRVSPSK